MLMFIFVVIALILIPTVVIPCLKNYLRYMDELSLRKNFDEHFMNHLS